VLDFLQEKSDPASRGVVRPDKRKPYGISGVREAKDSREGGEPHYGAQE